MPSNRDEMSAKLVTVYGPSNNLADWESQHWVAQGFEPCGPGDKASWYAANGATGTNYGDLEYSYWANVYTSAPSFLLQEDDFRLLQEDDFAILI